MRVEMTAKEFSEYTEYLNSKQRHACDPNWLVLRKEISDYCHRHATWRRSFSTQQNFIYGAIRLVTGVNQIDSLQGHQVATARAVFDELADWRERFSDESD